VSSSFLLLAALTTGALVASCDRGSPELSPLDTAPLRVVATSPADNQQDVATNAPIRVRFDRFLRPETAIRQSIRVTGGTIDAETGGAIAGETYLEPTYDAVERVVTFRLPAGSAWAPGVRYTVTLWAARDNGGFGAKAWDGQELAASVVFAFTPGTTTDDVAVAPVPAAYCGSCVDNVPVLGARDVLRNCAISGCHAGKEPEVGLNLEDRAGIERTALRLPAHETFTGPSSTDAPTNPNLFGVNMPIIDPGNPGNSFLLFKSMIRPDNYETNSGDEKKQLTSDQPVGGEKTPSDAEIVRLENAFVKGQPMPVFASIGIHQLRTLQAWIAAGAPLQDDASCPDLSQCGAVPSDDVPLVEVPTYAADIAPILVPSCGTTSGCHVTTDVSPAVVGLDFSGSPTAFVGKKRIGDDTEIIVTPGDPDASFLLNKVIPNLTGAGLACEATASCGSPMPLIGDKLTPNRIENIRRWIAAGAQDN
jgi:hypothetical protein